MVSVMYPHFLHRASPGTAITDMPLRRGDPATSRFGETLYAFLPRTIFSGILSAWQFETGRLERRGYHWFNYRNQMIRYGVEVLALLGIVYYFFGTLGLAAFVVQSGVAIMTLEVINYIQHYGLMRKEIAPGRYENTGVAHSWNSECWFSNGYWLNLGRHSDHHYVAKSRFRNVAQFQEMSPNCACRISRDVPARVRAAALVPGHESPCQKRIESRPASSARRSSGREYRTSTYLDPEPGYGGWRSSIVDGSGVLLGFSVVLLFGIVIWSFGSPVGLMTLSFMCLSLVAAAR